MPSKPSPDKASAGVRAPTGSWSAPNCTRRSTPAPYLWAYPAGLDWFAALADTAPPDTVRRVLRAAFQRPLTPVDLAALWPSGPVIGGTSDHA